MTSVALVHEWFTTLAGSERVVEQFCDIFPEADLFAIYAERELVARTSFLRDRRLRTSFIEHLPGTARHFRNYLMLMPLAVEQFDLSPYELVISSNHAAAKGVLTGPDQLHISYVHTPIRYAWDLQHQYLRESGLTTGLKGWLAKWMLHKMRIWDYRTAAGVDHFVANSRYIARRIQKVYGRRADVVYPPVDVERFTAGARKDDFYLAASRLVPYKRMDLVVRAFATMPERRLVVIGDGPEREKLAAHATPNVELLGYQPFPVLKDLLERARAFVFAAEEDFGIVLVEAQAAGTPVIALGKGGALETVKGLDDDEPTGVFFARQEVGDLVEAVKRFEAEEARFLPEHCRRNALRFSAERFRAEFSRYVEDRVGEFKAPRRATRPRWQLAEAGE